MDNPSQQTKKALGDLVEWKLGLVPGTYVPFKCRRGEIPLTLLMET